MQAVVDPQPSGEFNYHPAWKGDTKVAGEAMKIALPRYLARTLGRLIANAGPSDELVAGILAAAVCNKPSSERVSELFNNSVQALGEVRTIAQGEEAMERLWGASTTERNRIPDQTKIAEMLAVLKKSCQELFNSLLTKPEGPDFKNHVRDKNNETLLSAEFSEDGSPRVLTIALLAGRLSSEWLYRLGRFDLDTSPSKEKDPKIVVEVRALRSSSESRWSYFKNVSAEEIQKAYLEAIIHYIVEYARQSREME